MLTSTKLQSQTDLSTLEPNLQKYVFNWKHTSIIIVVVVVVVVVVIVIIITFIIIIIVIVIVIIIIIIMRFSCYSSPI